MDNKDKSVNERWAPGSEPRERGYATDPGFASTGDYATTGEYAVDRRASEAVTDDAITGDADTDRRTADIRRDIDRTRADMGETLDAIQDRLRPANVVSRAAQSAKDAATGKVRQIGQAMHRNRFSSSQTNHGSNGFVDRIRENPLPAAIAAASLAWLAFGGRRQRYDDGAIYGTTVNGEPFIRETRIDLDADTDRGESNWGGQTQSDSGQENWTGQAQQAVGRATSQLRDRAQDVRYRGRQFANQSPMAAGMLAAIAGLAIGMMIPETERENQLMGETRDSLVDRGRETVKDAAQQVQRVASDVTDTAKRIVGDGGSGETKSGNNL